MGHLVDRYVWYVLFGAAGLGAGAYWLGRRGAAKATAAGPAQPVVQPTVFPTPEPIDIPIPLPPKESYGDMGAIRGKNVFDWVQHGEGLEVFPPDAETEGWLPVPSVDEIVFAPGCNSIAVGKHWYSRAKDVAQGFISSGDNAPAAIFVKVMEHFGLGECLTANTAAMQMLRVKLINGISELLGGVAVFVPPPEQPQLDPGVGQPLVQPNFMQKWLWGV